MVGLRASELNEEEADALDHLAMIGQIVHHDPLDHEDLPFQAVLFMPIALWNDDQTAPEQEFRVWRDGSLLADLASRMQPVLERRLEEAWINPAKDERFEVECLPGWNLEQVRRAIERGDTDLYQPQLMAPKERLALEDAVDPKGGWLRAGVMPVLVRGPSYESLAGLDFNADHSFDEATADLRSERWAFSDPCPFMEAVVEADRARWNLWAQTLIEGPLTPTAVLRNTEFVVYLNGTVLESVTATVRDLDSHGKVLQTWTAQRKLDDIEDWHRVLNAWIYTASLAFRWTVNYEKAPVKTLTPSFDGIRHVRQMRVPAGTTLH